jgi:hypothetical protein
VDDYLVVLRAFRQLQLADGFNRSAPHYAHLYQLWAQGAVPRYRKQLNKARRGAAGVKETALDNSKPDGQVLSASPDGGFIPDSARLSSVASALDASIMTPVTNKPFDYYRGGIHSPLTDLMPKRALSYGYRTSVHGNLSSGGDRQAMSAPQSNQVLVTPATDEFSIPIPPPSVLLAWHAHLMRPDLYEQATRTEYKALRGVAFPLRELVRLASSDAKCLTDSCSQAQAIRDGALPLDLELFGSESGIRIGHVGPGVYDLADMIHSQACFIDHVHKSGMLQEGLLSKNHAPGSAAIVRYRTPLCCSIRLNLI